MMIVVTLIFLPQVGYLTFNQSASVHFNLNTYKDKQQLINALYVEYTAGLTNTSNSILYVFYNNLAYRELTY